LAVAFSGPYMTTAVDIYDYSTGNWATGNLSQGRAFMSVASSYNLALFGGGVIDFNTGLAATAVGEYVAFGGGTLSNGTTVSLVEVYNTVNMTWFTLTISQPRTFPAAISSENKTFFGGGQFGNVSTNIVDIFDFSAALQTALVPLAPTSLTLPSMLAPRNAASATSPNSSLIGGLIGA
jgi:hypothetical protein